MPHPSVHPATLEDMLHVGRNLKADDRLELGGGISDGGISGALTISSKVLAWTPEGSSLPTAIFGVVPEGNSGPVRVGYVWSLSTPGVYREWRAIHRAAPAILDVLGEGYQVLANVKDTRNEHHCRWLQSLGFVFIANLKGEDGVTYYEFVRIQKQ